MAFVCPFVDDIPGDHSGCTRALCLPKLEVDEMQIDAEEQEQATQRESPPVETQVAEPQAAPRARGADARGATPSAVETTGANVIDLDPDKPIEIDQLIVRCKGCLGERVFYPDATLVGAQAFIDWLQRIPACSCGAGVCDVKARMKGSKATE